MKIKLISNIAQNLEKLFALDILIVDDNAVYFNEQMISTAHRQGLGNIKRLFQIDSGILDGILKEPPDIIILDVKGITSPDIAKDGLALANSLSGSISSYIVVTSAHKYHLTNRVIGVDYFLEQRLLTTVDFIEHLRKIRFDCLNRKKKFYQNICLRLAITIGKAAIAH